MDSTLSDHADDLTSSANTALAGMTKRYDNAVTVILPLINDTGGFLTATSTESMRLSRFKHFTGWAITCEGKCHSGVYFHCNS